MADSMEIAGSVRDEGAVDHQADAEMVAGESGW
jgi:hypothetical protein